MRIVRHGMLQRREERWSRNFNANDAFVKELERRMVPETSRATRLAVAATAVLHVAFLVISFPASETELRTVTREQRVYRLQRVQFQPPEPQVRRSRPKPRPNARRVPIPDPTPDDPEPLELEEVDASPLDFPEVDLGAVVAVPDGPPGPSFSPIYITGDVEAPERIHAPQPKYPEEARISRVQGVVVLQTIIDTLGNVTNIKVLKGLPSGLTEAAVESVSSWRFNPALLDGQPVAVYYLVTVSFSMQ